MSINPVRSREHSWVKHSRAQGSSSRLFIPQYSRTLVVHLFCFCCLYDSRSAFTCDYNCISPHILSYILPPQTAVKNVKRRSVFCLQRIHLVSCTLLYRLVSIQSRISQHIMMIKLEREQGFNLHLFNQKINNKIEIKLPYFCEYNSRREEDFILFKKEVV